MKTWAFIIALVLFPVLSFAMMPKAYYIHSTDSNQYVALQAEKMIGWKTDLPSRSMKISNDVESEKEMIVEQWMLDVNEPFWLDEEDEEEIQVEEWMCNPDSDFWKLNTDEEEIEIETWMCNPSSWLTS